MRGVFSKAKVAPEPPTPDPDAKVLTYSLPVGEAGAAVSGVIDDENGTIAVAAVADTVVTALAATFTLTEGASAKVGSTAQVSGTTENDFTNPVEYEVAGEGLTTKTYTVTVTVAV